MASTCTFFRRLAPLIAAALVCQHADAQTRLRNRLMGVASEPVAVVHAPGDDRHVFICEVPGRIRVMDVQTGAMAPSLFLDITSQVSDAGDGGLLGLVFDPQYQSNGYFYVFYNALPSPPDDRVLARYRATPGSLVADAQSAQVLWRFPRTIGHNGGWIGFSPVNGYLYLSTGDGGTSFTAPDIPNNAQTIVGNLLGKMLRIDVRGDDFPAEPLRNFRIPPSNPFANAVGDDEIWAYGLRNPWRCSFDRLTGDLFIADVGLDMWEEINVEPAGFSGGRNYGWKCMEGAHCTGIPAGAACQCPPPSAGLTLPVLEYDHNEGRSITGGYVYRGSRIPWLYGRYTYADFQLWRIWSVQVNATTGTWANQIEHTQELRPPPPATDPIMWISAFGEDAAGELYLCDYVSGSIYKIVPACPPDFNGVGGVSVQDVFDFLVAWFQGDPRADFNAVGGVSVQDVFDFLTAWFLGC